MYIWLFDERILVTLLLGYVAYLTQSAINLSAGSAWVWRQLPLESWSQQWNPFPQSCLPPALSHSQASTVSPPAAPTACESNACAGSLNNPWIQVFSCTAAEDTAIKHLEASQVLLSRAENPVCLKTWAGSVYHITVIVATLWWHEASVQWSFSSWGQSAGEGGSMAISSNQCRLPPGCVLYWGHHLDWSANTHSWGLPWASS